jgi:hypothetical protein
MTETIVNFNLLNDIELRELLLINSIKLESLDRSYLIAKINKLWNDSKGEIEWIPSLSNKVKNYKYENKYGYTNGPNYKDVEAFLKSNFFAYDRAKKLCNDDTDSIKNYNSKTIKFNTGHIFYRLSKDIHDLIDEINKDEIWLFQDKPTPEISEGYCNIKGFNNCRLFELKLKKDINLIDMSDRNTVLKLLCDDKIDSRFKQIIYYAFPVDRDNINRFSQRNVDHNFSYELCKLGYDGIIYQSESLAIHHDEINICNPSTTVEYVSTYELLSYVYPIEISYPVTKHLPIDYITNKRQFITNEIKQNIDPEQDTIISLRIYYQMFDLYNIYFFNGFLPKTNISLRNRDHDLNKPLTTTKRDGKYNIYYKEFYKEYYNNYTNFKYGNILCNDIIECIQIMFESELINLAILNTFKSKTDRDNEIFRLDGILHNDLYKAYFGADIGIDPVNKKQKNKLRFY